MQPFWFAGPTIPGAIRHPRAFNAWCLIKHGVFTLRISTLRQLQREANIRSAAHSKSHATTVGQSVLVSSPIWGSWPDINYCLTIIVLSISGAPSDERSGLSFVTWTASVQLSKFAAGPRQLLILTRHSAAQEMSQVKLKSSFRGFSIVARVFTTVDTCLPCSSLATAASSGSTTLALSRHATILII
jgi:hypothetical protein